MVSRVRLFLTLLGIAALLVAGCGGSDDSSSTTAKAGAGASHKTIYVFAYFPHSLGTGTWAWYNGWQKAAQELKPDVNVVIKEMDKLELEPANYLNFIRTSLVTKPDGVIVVPNSGAALASGLQQMQAQNPGIKWLAMDQPIPGLDVVSYVGTDNRDAGRQAAQYLIDQQGAGKLKSDEVAVFKAPPGATSQDERVAGFLDGIKGSPLKVVKTIQAQDTSRATGRANMIDVLTAHPDVGAVFSATDNYGLPVATALAASHKLDVVNVSVDADDEAVKLIIDGKGMNAEVAQHFYDMGYKAVTTLAQALGGQTVPKAIDTGTTVVTKPNAAAYLKKAAVEGAPSK
jgi:ribose transport system substrate-binding protein